MKKYYKTNSIKLLEAYEENRGDLEKVRIAGTAFADHFGGCALYSVNLGVNKVAGLCFTPHKQSKLWTKPDKSNAMSQRPRASITKSTIEEKSELSELNEEWKSRFPLCKADFSEVLALMGTNSFSCKFMYGMRSFMYDGFVYASTKAKLADCMQEILASEYEVANIAFDINENNLTEAA